MTQQTDSTYSLDNKHWKTYVFRGLRGLCPRCGEGALFASRYKLTPQCTACSLVYRREQGAMTGQLYLAAVVTQIFAALVIGVVFVFTDWSPTVSIIVGLSALALFSAWVLPKTSALWVVIEFMTDVGNGEKSVFERSADSDGSARS